MFQSKCSYLTHRIRQQAGSYREFLCSARWSALPLMLMLMLMLMLDEL
jgi:hypothetical protein